MTDQQKELIIGAIISEAETKGSSRVGYHAEQILKESLDGKPIPYSIKSKLEGSIVSNRKYKSRKHPNFVNDFEIILNADYKESTWVERNPFWDRVRTGSISAIFSLIVGIGLYLLTMQKHNQREIQQNKQIQTLSDSITTLRNLIKDSQ